MNSRSDGVSVEWRRKILDVLDTNGRVCRNVVNREPCGTVEES